MITELQKRAHATAKKNGFWLDAQILESKVGNDHPLMDQIYGNRLMHISSELGEAWEELRKHGKTEKFTEELADVVIVLFDLAGKLELNLEETILSKMEKNESRERLHGKRF